MSDFFEKLVGSEKIKGFSEEKGKQDTAEEHIKKQGGDSEEEKGEEGQLAIDVFQTDQEIVIQSTIAGVKAEELDIIIQNDTVSIRGERKKAFEVEPQNYFYQECYWGPFSRSVILPEEVKAEKSFAELKDGILTLHLPKAEKSKITKVKITG